VAALWQVLQLSPSLSARLHPLPRGRSIRPTYPESQKSYGIWRRWSEFLAVFFIPVGKSRRIRPRVSRILPGGKEGDICPLGQGKLPVQDRLQLAVQPPRSRVALPVAGC